MRPVVTLLLGVVFLKPDCLQPRSPSQTALNTRGKNTSAVHRRSELLVRDPHMNDSLRHFVALSRPTIHGKSSAMRVCRKNA
jgi:hypothetical protein